MVTTENQQAAICESCKLKDLGCVVKGAVLASGGNSCKFYSVQKMEKTAEQEYYTVSWPVGDKRIVSVSQNGKIISREIHPI